MRDKSERPKSERRPNLELNCSPYVRSVRPRQVLPENVWFGYPPRDGFVSVGRRALAWEEVEEAGSRAMVFKYRRVEGEMVEMRFSQLLAVDKVKTLPWLMPSSPSRALEVHVIGREKVSYSLPEKFKAHSLRPSCSLICSWGFESETRSTRKWWKSRRRLVFLSLPPLIPSDSRQMDGHCKFSGVLPIASIL